MDNEEIIEEEATGDADYDERETSIRIGQDSKTVSIWTCIPAHVKRFMNTGFEPVRVSRSPEGEPIGWWFEIPVRSFYWSLKAPKAAKNPKAEAVPADPAQRVA